MGGAVDTAKGMLGLNRTDTSSLNQYKLTPEQIESEKRLMAQIEAQSLNTGAAPESDLAQRKAMSMAASQSRNASNPFLGIKAAQMANMEGQEQAQMNQLARQAQSQQLMAGILGNKEQLSSQMNQAQMNQRAAENKQRTDFIGNLAGSAGSFFSDERIKENKQVVSDSGGKIDDFLKSIDPYTFEYKNKELGGKQLGVMAQDLEKSDIGRSMVEEFDGVKTVNTNKLAMPILAAQSDMFKRLKELEDKVKKRA